MQSVGESRKRMLLIEGHCQLSRRTLSTEYLKKRQIVLNCQRTYTLTSKSRISRKPAVDEAERLALHAEDLTAGIRRMGECLTRATGGSSKICSFKGVYLG